MYQLVLIIHIFAAVCLVALVLVQQGKGATVGAAFGSGASQTVFGSRGSGSFLYRLTMTLVAVFFATSIAMNYMAAQAVKQQKQLNLPVLNQENSIPPPVSPNSIPGVPVEAVKPPVPVEKNGKS